jgi:hypothetical protein
VLTKPTPSDMPLPSAAPVPTPAGVATARSSRGAACPTYPAIRVTPPGRRRSFLWDASAEPVAARYRSVQGIGGRGGAPRSSGTDAGAVSLAVPSRGDRGTVQDARRRLLLGFRDPFDQG